MRIAVILACMLSLFAEAQGSREVPLMNQGVTREVRKISYSRRTSRKQYRLADIESSDAHLRYDAESVPTERPTWGFGIEAGALGRPNNADSDLFGLHYVFGGRFAAYGPIARNWAVKPSIGYYYRDGGTTGISVTEHQVQGQFDFFFAPGQHKKFWWMGGLAQRVDMVITRMNALRSSVSSDPEFRYNFGPTMALALRLGSAVLHLQGTLTFQPTQGGLDPSYGLNLGLLLGPSNKTYTTRRRPRNNQAMEYRDELSRR